MTTADSDTPADTGVPTNHPASQTGDRDPAELRALAANW